MDSIQQDSQQQHYSGAAKAEATQAPVMSTQRSKVTEGAEEHSASGNPDMGQPRRIYDAKSQKG